MTIELLIFSRIFERANEVFEDDELAINWLKFPNSSLGGVTPLSLMHTKSGADLVMDTLGRIEHGVFP